MARRSEFPAGSRGPASASQRSDRLLHEGNKTEIIMVRDPISDVTATRLRALLPPGLKLEHGASRDEAHQQEIIADADYAISGQIGVPGTVLRAARRLKLLHKW